MKYIKANHCPKCGSKDLTLVQTISVEKLFDDYFVECKSCRYHSKPKSFSNVAIWCWNHSK